MLSQVSQFISRKNDSNFLFFSNDFLKRFYGWIVIANVVISWLIAFNVLKYSIIVFVYNILDVTYRLTDPFLRKIRAFLPNLGAFDISPIILLVLIDLAL